MKHLLAKEKLQRGNGAAECEENMGKKVKAVGTLLEKKELSPGIFSYRIQQPEIAKEAIVGQFVSIFCKEGTRILPRPISICEINRMTGCLRLVFRVNGAGTEEFSRWKTGERVELMGPLGNGFTDMEEKRCLLIAGGIGIPPILGLAKELRSKGKVVKVVLGYRDQNCFLSKEFATLVELHIATEDGSKGDKGTVIDVLNKKQPAADVIYACGPIPMLRAVKEYANQKQCKAYLSMEEKMACGIGACLACTCQSAGTSEETNVNNRRVCKDGPVFLANDIIL